MAVACDQDVSATVLGELNQVVVTAIGRHHPRGSVDRGARSIPLQCDGRIHQPHPGDVVPLCDPRVRGAPCALRPKAGGRRSFRRHLRATGRGAVMLPRTPPGFRRSDNLHRRQPATCDQDRDDRDGDLLDRRLSLPSCTTRWAKACASSSPSPAFALMRSMIPRPSRRAASSTSESRRPIRAARTRTWRISPSSIDSVVFTFPIFPYCHTDAIRAMA